MGMLSNIFSKIISTASGASINGKIAEQIKTNSDVIPAQQAETSTISSNETPVNTTGFDAVFETLDKVDVVSTLDELVQKSAQQLNWKTSIVDLLKLLGLDSSLDARKKLAAELNYTDSTEDSATMNIWLHKAVMQKIADNGGNVKDLF